MIDAADACPGVGCTVGAHPVAQGSAGEVMNENSVLGRETYHRFHLLIGHKSLAVTHTEIHTQTDLHTDERANSATNAHSNRGQSGAVTC